MKRLSLALAAMGLTAGAFAALPAATDPTVVNVPQLPGGFVVGVSGYYLQPSNSNGDLDYATVNTSTSGINSSFFGSNLHNVDSGYDWGWGVNVGYIFPNTGNDVNLSYFQLDTSDTSSAFPVPFDLFNGVVDGTDLGPITAHSKAEYDLNQVDLTFGQYIDVGCRLILHPFAGLRWAQLDRKLDSNYSQSAFFEITNTNYTDSQHVSESEESDFEGIGPIVGIDASYYVGMGFGVVGHFDSALLVGNIDAKTNLNVSQLETSAAGTFSSSESASARLTASDTRRIVPVLDAKLGLDYTYVFNNSANSDLTLEAGWMVSNYFNAVDRLVPDVTIEDAVFDDAIHPITSATVAGRSTSDFAVQGPYVSLVYHA